MFYLQGKPNAGRNSTFASIRLFYLHVVAYLGCLRSYTCRLFYFSYCGTFTDTLCYLQSCCPCVGLTSNVTMKCTSSISNIRNLKG